MVKTVADSELHFEKVKDYFWRETEADFVIRFDATDMCQWELIPTSSIDDMIDTRLRLSDENTEFAGFVWYEGRYCYYFHDRNILKVQYLDNNEIDYFAVHSATEFSAIELAQVAKELRELYGS
jgi:hypothetical protein